MKAEKGNREYLIDKSQKKFYQDRGFDIKDDNGNIISHGRGKTVPYDEYEKVIAKNKKLEEQAVKMREELDAVTAKTKKTQKPEKDNNAAPDDDSKKVAVPDDDDKKG